MGEVAVGDDPADVIGEGGEIVVGERLCFVVGFGEFRAPGVEAGELLGEGGDAGRAGLLGHGAVLERPEVTVERVVDLAQFGVDPLQLLLVLRSRLLEFGEGVRDRLSNERLLFEGGEELAHDRGLELLGGEAVVVADLGAVALAGVADVVGVASAVAVRGGADVALAAAGAGDEAGEQVVGGVGAPQRGVLGALGEHLLSALEEGGFDERRVGASWCWPRKGISPR